MKVLILFCIFAAASCQLYPRYRFGVRPKRQDDLITNKVNTLNDPDLYAQVPADQLGPHLQEPVQDDTQVEDQEDEEPVKTPQEFNPVDFFSQGQNGQRGIVNFFPILLRGGFGRSGVEDSQGSVAIANSFSTGRKGVATSNAVANGDPYGRRANFQRGVQEN